MNEDNNELFPRDSDYAHIYSQPVQTPEESLWTEYAAPAAMPEVSGEFGKEKKTRKPVGVGAVIAICLICAIVVSLISVGATYLVLTRGGGSFIGEVVDSIVPTPVPRISTTSSGSVNEVAASAIYELAKQQVVGITTEITYGYNIFGQATAASVTGSGVIITADGYILTNYHVIEDAQERGYQASVMLYDETTYDAQIVGFDADSDLALVKIDAQGLSAAELGDSAELVVGQTVYAVGNPLGELAYTMTSGMISATDRTITTESDVAINMFQIDAAVNGGNSGGPVYNAYGQVIGIVTAKYSATGVEGLGFAIPIDDAAHIANQILEFGYVKDKASLGVKVVTVTESIARYYNMVEGAYVNEVNSGSAAETAGLQAGDIIIALGGQEVTSDSELTSLVKGYHAGDTAELTAWRSGEELTLTVTFDEKIPEEETEEGASDEMQQAQPYQPYAGDMEDFFRQFFGFGF